MSESLCTPFGRYILLDRIAQGGMAEIFRARQKGGENNSRLVVVKRIHSSFGSNEEFRRMFRDETKITMGFSHPNIVSIFDFGDEAGQPYIAMEYLDGRNLRQLLLRVQESGDSVPIALALFIAEQVAAGLDYAHRYKDRISGESLSIVHRDISPQNILVSFDGSVKIIDFGIAKANSNDESTKAGVIKGKLSYLSPEQISGQGLDGRSDIFALGIVLWEMLTGRKCFSVPQGEHEVAVLKMIDACDTSVKPPSRYNGDVPRELDYLVLRCLARSRDKRFATAEDLRKACHRLLVQIAPDFSPRDLGLTLRDRFADEIVADRKNLQALNERSYVVEKQGAPPPTSSPSQEARVPETKREIKPMPTQPPLGESVSISVREAPRVELLGQLPRGEVPPGIGSATTSRTHSSRIPNLRKQIPDPVPFRRSASSAGQRMALLSLLLVGVSCVYYYREPLGLTPDQLIPGVVPVLVEASSDSEAKLPGKDEVFLKLKILPAGGPRANIRVNKVWIPEETAQSIVRLMEPVEISIERPGFERFRRVVAYDPAQLGSRKELLEVIEMTPLRAGTISISTTPSSVVSLSRINGSGTGPAEGPVRPYRVNSPVDGLKLPEGHYAVTMKNEVLNMERKIQISLEAGQTLRIEERLVNSP